MQPVRQTAIFILKREQIEPTSRAQQTTFLILRCEPPGLAFGKPEDRLREPRRTH